MFIGAFAAAIKPRQRRSVSHWAAAPRRQVSAESGSPFPGDWSNDRVPGLVEIMDVLTPAHPCREVVFRKAHQIGGTETAVNLVLYCIDEDPQSVLYVLPSLDEASKWVKVKLHPSLDVSPPDLRRKVKEQRSRGDDGSTTAFKKFRGGFLLVTGANSSKGLKMVSARILICDEVTEWPADVDKQGDPLALAEKRTTAYSRVGYKRFYLSTPGEKSTCRITRKYEASDQRLRYVPCPHCGWHQVLEWRNFDWNKTAPGPDFGAHFVCQAPGCGCLIEYHHLPAMDAAGAWIKTFPGPDVPPKAFAPEDLDTYRARSSEGRSPGFHLWQAYSQFVSWDDIVKTWLEAQADPLKAKDFTRQVLAEAYEEIGEAPDAERLFERRQPYKLRQLPPGTVFITGAADVQGNRLEWAVYAWGVGLTSWLIDKGVIEGDPNLPETWARLEPVIDRRYADGRGRTWQIDAFGIDTGYLSSKVYAFVARQAHKERVYALDGRGGERDRWLPPLGTAKPVDVDFAGRKIGACLLWPVGTWDMKSEHYAALRKTVQGPDADGVWPMGCAHYPDACDRAYFDQLTAEYLGETAGRNGRTVSAWIRPPSRANEALDIAVYSRALVHHLSDGFQRDDWARLAAERAAEPATAQLDLTRYWSGIATAKAAEAGTDDTGTDDEPANAVRQEAAAPVPPSAGWMGGRGRNWFTARR